MDIREINWHIITIYYNDYTTIYYIILYAYGKIILQNILLCSEICMICDFCVTQQIISVQNVQEGGKLHGNP